MQQVGPAVVDRMPSISRAGRQWPALVPFTAIPDSQAVDRIRYTFSSDSRIPNGDMGIRLVAWPRRVLNGLTEALGQEITIDSNVAQCVRCSEWSSGIALTAFLVAFATARSAKSWVMIWYGFMSVAAANLAVSGHGTETRSSPRAASCAYSYIACPRS